MTAAAAPGINVTRSTREPPNPSFDRFADQYDRMPGEEVSLSGESADYSTPLKIDLKKCLVRVSDHREHPDRIIVNSNIGPS